MGIFSRKTRLTLPAIAQIALPDPRWTKRHLQDVRAMLEAADLTKDDPENRSAAKILAEAFMTTWRVAGDQVANATEVRASLETGARLGHAFATLYTADRDTPPEIYDALQWASLTMTPRTPKDFVAAMIFACHAGHYYGHFGPATLPALLDQLDWREVFAVSPRAAVLVDASKAAWDSIKQT